MTDPQYTQPPRPPIVQIGPTEMAGALEEVRRKLEEQSSTRGPSWERTLLIAC
jgi:hypothetical protein